MLVAYVDDNGTEETVFTVTVHADGTYEFELARQLDHADGNGENDLDLTFTFDGVFDVADKLDGTDYDLDPDGLPAEIDFQGRASPSPWSTTCRPPPTTSTPWSKVSATPPRAT